MKEPRHKILDERLYLDSLGTGLSLLWGETSLCMLYFAVEKLGETNPL